MKIQRYCPGGFQILDDDGARSYFEINQRRATPGFIDVWVHGEGARQLKAEEVAELIMLGFTALQERGGELGKATIELGVLSDGIPADPEP